VKKSKEQKQMEQLVEQQKKMLKQQQKAMKQKATATNDLGESNESLFDSKKTAKKKVVKVVKKSKEQKQMERLVEQQKKMLKQFNKQQQKASNKDERNQDLGESNNRMAGLFAAQKATANATPKSHKAGSKDELPVWMSDADKAEILSAKKAQQRLLDSMNERKVEAIQENAPLTPEEENKQVLGAFSQQFGLKAVPARVAQKAPVPIAQKAPAPVEPVEGKAAAPAPATEWVLGDARDRQEAKQAQAEDDVDSKAAGSSGDVEDSFEDFVSKRQSEFKHAGSVQSQDALFSNMKKKFNSFLTSLGGGDVQLGESKADPHPHSDEDGSGNANDSTGDEEQTRGNADSDDSAQASAQASDEADTDDSMSIDDLDPNHHTKSDQDDASITDPTGQVLSPSIRYDETSLGEVAFDFAQEGASQISGHKAEIASIKHPMSKAQKSKAMLKKLSTLFDTYTENLED